MEDEIWTPKEIADHFKVQERAVRRWLNDGKLKGFKMGHVWRVTVDDLRDFIKAEGRDPLPGDNQGDS